MGDFFHVLGVNIIAGISAIAFLFSGAAHTITDLQSNSPFYSNSGRTLAAVAMAVPRPSAMVPEVSATSTATIVNQYLTQPIIERIIQSSVVPATDGYVTQKELAEKLNELSNKFGAVLYGSTYPAPATNYGGGGLISTIALMSKIDTLSNVTIANATITGGSVTATAFSGLLGVSLGGTGTTTAPTYGQILVGNSSSGYTLTATSSLGIASGASLSAANSWSAWQIFSAGASTTQLSAFDSLYVGRTATTTIRGDGVASVLPYASSTAFSVSANAYFPGSGIWNSSGNVGIGTTTPWAQLSVNPNGITGPSFVIGSSTATNFIVTNGGNVGIGIGTTSPASRLDITNSATSSAIITLRDVIGNVSMEMRAGTSTLDNTFVGKNAGFSNTIGANITAYGAYALYSNNAGQNATAYGAYALYSNTTGYQNTAVGPYALRDNTLGDYNTAIGYNTGRGITTGDYNTIIGAQVIGLSADLQNNVIIADGAGNRRINVDSTGNVGIGTTSPYAKMSVVGAVVAAYFHATSTNATSTFAGGLTTGSSGLNVLVNGRVGIGTSTPAFPLDVYSSVSSEQTYGWLNSAGATGNTTGTNNYSIRAQDRILASEFNAVSDARLKDIQFNLNPAIALRAILQLQPISFTWKSNPTGQPILGFIAQEVEVAIPNAVSKLQTDKFSDQRLLDYNQIVAVSVGAIKEIASVAGMFKDTLIAWMGDAGNGIKNFFADTITANKELCVKKSDGTPVCVTGDQLAVVISGLESSIANLSVPSGADTEPPEIHINGENPAHIKVGDIYSDLGATVTDNVDNNIGLRTFVGSTLIEWAPIETKEPATYHIYYVATDNAGNTATSTRTVVISDIAL